MTESQTKILDVPLKLIDCVDQLNGRFEISTDRVNSLAHNIQNIGLIHPITLRKKDDRFELIAGNHRFLAFQRLGITTIPACLIECDDNQAALTRLSENAARTSVTPVEEARQLHHLVEIDPNGVDGVALKIGRSVDWILNRLEIMSWPGALIEYVHSKKISLAAAKRLAQIKPEPLQLSYIHDAAEHGINTRTATLWLQQSRSQSPQNFEPSEKTRKDPILEYKTSTEVNCFTCKEMIPLENTHSVRICHECVEALENRVREIESQPQNTIDRENGNDHQQLQKLPTVL